MKLVKWMLVAALAAGTFHTVSAMDGVATVTGGDVQYQGAADVQWVGGTELLLKFTGEGSFVLPDPATVRILAIGGGGGGGGVCTASSAMTGQYGGGGGGGAGGFVDVTNVLPAATYVVAVGAGGAGGASRSNHLSPYYPGTSGGDTTLSTNGVAWIVAHGGGGGGGETDGLSGGGGGGGSQFRQSSTVGVACPGGAGTPGQGSAGGAGDLGLYGGGGGGAGGAGASASTLNPVGGDGLTSDITGEAVWYAGGGGGGFCDKSFTGLHEPVAGGRGGGGNGGYGRNVPATDATFYGGGGGGCGALANSATTSGGNGHPGVVYVRIVSLDRPVTTFPLWVGGVQVCDTNRTDILGDGTASFVGTATNGTLFLADATITGAYSFGGSAPPYTAAVYADFDFDLEIALSGSNRVVNTNGTSWGCYPRGNLVIAGDGVLDVEAGTQGIFVSGSLLVRDATVVVDCHSACALGARGIAISNAVVTAVSEGNGPAIESSGDLVIADSTVVSTGIDCSIESFDGSIRISGASRVTAETLQENGNALFAEDGDVVLEGDNGIVAPAGGWVGEHDTSFYAVRAVLDPATGAPATRVVIDTLPPPAITNVVATPDATEGTVELSFFVENDPAAGRPAWNRPVLVVTATDHETGSNHVSAASALSGQTDAAPGAHLVTWDYGAQGVRLDSASVTFAVSYLVMPDWCVVDLSGGKDATRHPVSYLDAPPAGGFDNDAFTTANLALRLVSPGSFSMGSSRDEDNKPHRVTLTNAYYIAVFEATQRQWELVTGKRPSFFKSDAHYATRPVEQVSYDMIRGADAGAGWPASRAVDGDSFLGKLRARTGVGAFDLPTEAQWEYACRAGTSTDYNSGKRMLNENQDANMGEVGRYLYNGGTDGLGKPDCTPDAGTAAVGSYEPNRWGLYDFHGNACEWCLDWSGDLANSANEPVGAPSGTSRVMRGGGWNGIASFCISSRRGSFAPSVSSSNIGFRLARTISGDTAAERAGEAASGAERAGTVCAGEAEAVEVIPCFAVTVEGGSTTNTTARAGETVTVVANAPAEGEGFVEWSADDAMDLSFATAAATTTTFAMPARAVTVTAVFKEIQIDSIPDQEWTGGPVEPEFRSDTVKFEGTDMVLLPGTDYTVSYTNNVDPGTATATVTMAPPRTGHASVTFQILPPPVPPAVSNVVARQRWPWNGLVDVDYEVGGYAEGLEARIVFQEQGGAGRSWVASNFLAGAEPSAEPGFHRATWDTKADGATNVVAANVVATVCLERSYYTGLYLVTEDYTVSDDGTQILDRYEDPVDPANLPTRQTIEFGTEHIFKVIGAVPDAASPGSVLYSIVEDAEPVLATDAVTIANAGFRVSVARTASAGDTATIQAVRHGVKSGVMTIAAVPFESIFVCNGRWVLSDDGSKLYDSNYPDDPNDWDFVGFIFDDFLVGVNFGIGAFKNTDVSFQLIAVDTVQEKLVRIDVKDNPGDEDAKVLLSGDHPESGTLNLAGSCVHVNADATSGALVFVSARYRGLESDPNSFTITVH